MRWGRRQLKRERIGERKLQRAPAKASLRDKIIIVLNVGSDQERLNFIKPMTGTTNKAEEHTTAAANPLQHLLQTNKAAPLSCIPQPLPFCTSPVRDRDACSVHCAGGKHKPIHRSTTAGNAAAEMKRYSCFQVTAVTSFTTRAHAFQVLVVITLGIALPA